MRLTHRSVNVQLWNILLWPVNALTRAVARARRQSERDYSGAPCSGALSVALPAKTAVASCENGGGGGGELRIYSRAPSSTVLTDALLFLC